LNIKNQKRFRIFGIAHQIICIMKAKIIISALFLFFITKTEAQSPRADCNNLYLDTTVFYLYPQQDSAVSGNLFYNDTLITFYPLLELIIQDTTLITSQNIMVLSALDSGFFQGFNFNLRFKTNSIPNNTIINAQFHIFDSDMPGDTIVDCYFPISIIIQNPNSLNKINNERFNVYPNPTSKQLNIEMANKQAIQEISITSMEGEQLYFRNPNTVHETIDFSGFSNGIYILKIKSNKEETVKRIIKH
jgi:Secretion system C-terminal sorting domain